MWLRFTGSTVLGLESVAVTQTGFGVTNSLSQIIKLQLIQVLSHKKLEFRTLCVETDQEE